MKSIRVLLTEQCNANCAFCINKTTRGSSLMDVPRFKHMCDYFKRNHITGIKIMGGEPTTHPHCIEMLEMAQQSFQKVSLFTNAINDTILQFKPRKNDGINYNFSFYKTLSKKKLLLDYPGYRALEIIIHKDTDEKNILKSILSLTRGETKRFSILLTLNCTEDIFAHRNILVYKIEKIFSTCKEAGLQTSFDHSIPICFIYGTKIPIFRKGAFCDLSCAGLIDADFNLCFCNQHPQKLINLFNEQGEILPIQILENHLKYIHFQNQITALNKICLNCIFFDRMCNGGCFITNRTITINSILQNTALPTM